MLKLNLKAIPPLLLSIHLLIPAPLFASDRALSPETLLQSSWLSMSHPRFKLMTDTNTEDAQALYRALSEFDFYIQRIMKPTISPNIKPVTIYAPTQRKNRALLSLVKNSVGFTHKSLRGNYIVADLKGFDTRHRASKQNALRTLKHEYIHYLTRNSQEFGDGLPLWLEEGLAEYWSTLRVGKMRVSYGHLKKENFQKMVSKRPIPISKLITTRALPTNLAKGQELYAHATLITHFLMSDTKRAAGLPQFVEAMRSGPSPEHAFRQWVQMSDGKLRHKLKRHVRDLHRHHQTSERVPFTVLAPLPEIAERTDLAMGFGALLTHFPGENPAPFLDIAQEDIQYFLTALTLSINRKVERNEFPQAEVLLSDVSPYYQGNPLWMIAKANLLLARARSSEPAVDESKRTQQVEALGLLNQALSLNPENLEAHFLRGIYYTDSGATEDIEQGITSWTRVNDIMHYSPSKYALAVLHLRKAEPDFDLAGDLLTNVLNTERRDLLVGSSQRILLKIREHQIASKGFLVAAP